MKEQPLPLRDPPPHREQQRNSTSGAARAFTVGRRAHLGYRSSYATAISADSDCKSSGSPMGMRRPNPRRLNEELQPLLPARKAESGRITVLSCCLICHSRVVETDDDL